jgi:hypothetical protein
MTLLQTLSPYLLLIEERQPERKKRKKEKWSVDYIGVQEENLSSRSQRYRSYSPALNS